MSTVYAGRFTEVLVPPKEIVNREWFRAIPPSLSTLRTVGTDTDAGAALKRTQLSIAVRFSESHEARDASGIHAPTLRKGQS